MNPNKYVFIAVNDADYLAMAVNLAISLRANGETLPFEIITNLAGEVDGQAMFQAVHTIIGKVNPFHLKTRLPEFASNAVYLDVDSVCFGDINDFAGRYPKAAFDTHHKQKPRPIFETSGENHHWGNPKKVARHYGINDQNNWYEINSSYLYVNAEAWATDLWKLAEHFFAAAYYPEYQHEGFFNYPDELAFETALATIDPMTPAAKILGFWDQETPWNWRRFTELKREFPIFSLAGAGKTTNLKLWQVYNREGFKMAKAMGKHWNRLTMESKLVVKSRGQKRFSGIREKTEGIERLLNKYRLNSGEN